MKKITRIVFFVFLIFLIDACDRKPVQSDEYLIHVFHAGSLSLPMKMIKESFEKQYPQYKIYLQACGSKQCIRNIVDFKKQWDIFLSADKALIDSILVPNYTSEVYPLVSNEMVIVFTPKSLYANVINNQNCFSILQKNEVRLAFSDPLSDPCGVRAIAVLTLAEHLYQKPNLLNQIRYKTQNVMIRPKEIDLIALLELGSADYTIIYKSLAIQHHLNYITLSDSINLSNPELQNWYSNFSVQIKQPNQQYIKEKIGLIEYAFCINKQSAQKNAVELFKNYIFSNEAKEILNQTGHRLLY